jgi:hypothetical protein
MEDETVSLKLKFNRLLEPVKAMLSARKSKLDTQEWEAFVERTKDSVIRCPDQFLGKDLPKAETIEIIITEIFNEFVTLERERQ